MSDDIDYLLLPLACCLGFSNEVFSRYDLSDPLKEDIVWAACFLKSGDFTKVLDICELEPSKSYTYILAYFSSNDLTNSLFDKAKK